MAGADRSAKGTGRSDSRSRISGRTNTSGESYWAFAARLSSQHPRFNPPPLPRAAAGAAAGAGEAAFVEFAACLKGDVAK